MQSLPRDFGHSTGATELDRRVPRDLPTCGRDFYYNQLGIGQVEIKEYK